MNEELAAALEPVKRDLAAGCAVAAEFREAHFGVGPSGVWILTPDGTGMGVSVVAGEGLTDRVARLADQALEWAVEALWSAGLPAVWPECPLHPRLTSAGGRGARRGRRLVVPAFGHDHRRGRRVGG